jgi:hypothetical protein
VRECDQPQKKRTPLRNWIVAIAFAGLTNSILVASHIFEFKTIGQIAAPTLVV